MKEQLYTIPVNDAFDADCECPICEMYRQLEANAIDFTMGPSYMEDDNRAVTDEKGFCYKHINMLYAQKNRLGLALMLDTHSKKIIRDLKAMSNQKPSSSAGLFKKAAGANAISDYVDSLEKKCFVCDRIEDSFSRYIGTIFALWKKDATFRAKLTSSKGFCVYHYGMLYKEAPKHLKDSDLAEFLSAVDKVFFDGLNRVNADIEWFIDLNDYRNQGADPKNSRDAIPRMINKTNHFMP
ncbi:MAG: DUF6062 family protein [Lachnospiraceae bacterium]|nr:DUF6062 family protein [Lachnospiraceae bacterium]